MVEIARRTLLLGGAGAAVVGLGVGGVLVNDGVLPGRGLAHRLLGLDGEDAPIPTVAPGPRYDGSFSSVARRGARTGWSLSVPPGHDGAGLPLVVALHGAGADHQTAFTSMGVDRFLAQAVAHGVAPFAVASVDGGTAGYWHPRADGTDSSAMVLNELVPLLRTKFKLSSGLALYGWSMGGYGALRMTMRGAPVRATAASSPALFASYAASAPGSFDSQADFTLQGLRGQGPDFPDVPARIDCGEGDPFYATVHDFVEAMPHRPAGGFEAGAHTYGYWRRVLPDQLRFLGQHLA